MKRMLASVLILAAASLPLPVAHGQGAYLLLTLDGRHVKWGAPELGTNASVSYAILDGAATASGVRNCKRVEGIEPLLDYAGLPREALEAELMAAFASWEKVANIRFRPAESVASADILIGAQAAPEGWAYTDIRPADARATDPIASIEKAILCINPKRAWRARDDATAGGDGFDLRYVLAHEIGHLLGLDHPGARGKLMSFHYDEAFRDMQPDDIAGAVALYGPPEFEP
jgi:hypothetical protein